MSIEENRHYKEVKDKKKKFLKEHLPYRCSKKGCKTCLAIAERKDKSHKKQYYDTND